MHLEQALHEKTNKIALKPGGNLYEPRVFSLFCDRNPRNLSTKPSCINKQHLPWHVLNFQDHRFATSLNPYVSVLQIHILGLRSLLLDPNLGMHEIFLALLHLHLTWYKARWLGWLRCNSWNAWKMCETLNPKDLLQLTIWQSSRSIIQCLFSSVSILRAHLQEILDP